MAISTSLAALPGQDSLSGQGNSAELITALIILLLVATGVALLSRRLRIPYVTGLVLAGLVIADLLPRRIGLDSSLILNLFLPILLFEAAINTDVSRLRSTVKPITLLAGPGVAIAAGVTATVLKFGLGLGWVQALLTGVILAITDTVSVIAVFKEVSVPSRLTTIVEGESLFNDGFALVLFSLILQGHTTGSVSPQDAVQQLILVICGGALLGVVTGYLSAGVLVRSADPLGSILLTVAVALGTFEVGELLHVSGVVAVVTAGLMVGSLSLSRGVSASSRITLLSFWEYAGFGVNTLIFLLIGLEIDLTSLWRSLPAILLAVLAYQVGRVLTVYPLSFSLGRFDRPIPLPWQHVLFLGNIKGSLSMALALGIPATVMGRGELVTLVFGSVLLSLVFQGLSLPWAVRRLQVTSQSESRQQIEELQAQLITAKAAQDELETLLKSGILPRTVYEELRSTYQVRIAAAEKTLRDLFNRRASDMTLAERKGTQLDAIRRYLLLAEKGALNEALRKRILTEEIVRERVQTIDSQLLKLEDD
ncbi:sodium:proton antiporter [Leptolyngbya sp. 'hensonii']|uniref:cation:proton antiporter n=1 Tax=Leptolyngbya sp. 'hensonii' TaxID=1922337 RepID=UPI00094FF632|nr:sodium:proton antiporter [Leptolyngbya sp. 'hensonii']OLP19054.1 sodium:proton antiporter [Leptolyngbya sp. 'hensonii']